MKWKYFFCCYLYLVIFIHPNRMCWWMLTWIIFGHIASLPTISWPCYIVHSIIVLINIFTSLQFKRLKRERSLEIERDSNVTSGSFSTVERKGIVTHFKIYPQKKKILPKWMIYCAYIIYKRCPSWNKFDVSNFPLLAAESLVFYLVYAFKSCNRLSPFWAPTNSRPIFNFKSPTNSHFNGPTRVCVCVCI